MPPLMLVVPLHIQLPKAIDQDILCPSTLPKKGDKQFMDFQLQCWEINTGKINLRLHKNFPEIRSKRSDSPLPENWTSSQCTLPPLPPP